MAAGEYSISRNMIIIIHSLNENIYIVSFYMIVIFILYFAWHTCTSTVTDRREKQMCLLTGDQGSCQRGAAYSSKLEKGAL